jgi:hypothetical protein
MITETLEQRYNRARAKNCLNCGRLASYLRLNGMTSAVTCRPDGITLSDDHSRRQGTDVEGCWISRGTS